MHVVEEQVTAPEREHRVYWWKEALIVAVFYAVYSWTRNLFGSNKIAGDGIPDQAFTNAVRVAVMTLRRKLGTPQVIQTVPGAGYRFGS